MCLLCVQWQQEKLSKQELISAMREWVAVNPDDEEHIKELYNEVVGVEND